VYVVDGRGINRLNELATKYEVIVLTL